MSVPRYSSREFPPYTYVPGSGTPHPVSSSAGHMHDADQARPIQLAHDNWVSNETYLYAVDLFNYGYYWEAHEMWESLWHAALRRGTVADFLKGLIKLAAAGVKSLEKNPRGVSRHAARSAELLHSVGEANYCGLSIVALQSDAEQLASGPQTALPRLELELPQS